MSKCPCEFKEVEPCHKQCTCREPMLSGGCTRCASYGSDEQRLAAAQRLVKQEKLLTECMNDLMAATAAKSLLCGQVEKLRNVLLATDKDMDTLISRLSELEEKWPNWRDPKEQEFNF